MTETIHPEATQHLPSFITAPGGTDVLMVVTAVFLVLVIVAFGVLFFRLHTLPERIAHRSHKVQFEIVAILGLISLFTHLHIFWIAGLILAFIDIPDFGTPLRRMAGSLETIAGGRPAEETAEIPAETAADGRPSEEEAGAPVEARRGIKQADGPAMAPAKPARASATHKERSHV